MKKIKSLELRVVLVGCGGITLSWLSTQVVKKQVRFVGFVDLNRALAQAKADAFGIPGAIVGVSLDKVLKLVDADAVFDCTIPKAHCEVTLTALRHGCHVLGEKPMAESLSDATKMVAAAQKSGKTYAVIQNRRFHPQMRTLRRFLESGKIGRMTTLQSHFFIGAHFDGFRNEMPHVLLLDMAIHTFDQARFLSRSDAKSVYCHEWNPQGSWYKQDASAIAIFEMTQGITYTYQGSWCSEGLETSWEAEWRIIGEKGTVVWDGADHFRAEGIRGRTGFIRPKKRLKIKPLKMNPQRCGHGGVIHNFIDSLQNNHPPETICTDNIKSLAMVHAAIQSAEKRRRVLV